MRHFFDTVSEEILHRPDRFRAAEEEAPVIDEGEVKQREDSLLHLRLAGR
jgi:hypothetical protein